MHLFGISTRRPTFGEITAASIMALGLWLLALGLMVRLGVQTTPFDAGALLLVMEWGCVAARIGIRPDLGSRHLLANLAVCALLLGAYSGVWDMLA